VHSARATSAAPTYFTPFSHPNSEQTYYDGGVYHNNPINIAERERQLIWPEVQEPDVVISIGTGYNPNNRELKKAMPYKPVATKGIISQTVFLANMAKDHIAVSLDSEQTWKDFLANNKELDERSRYVRLNTTFLTDPPPLDDLSKLKMLRNMAREQFADNYETSLLAQKLVASSFYFQPDEAKPLKRTEVTGKSRYFLLKL
jgi:predicted acylesterase/phospholipase RssA